MALVRTQTIILHWHCSPLSVPFFLIICNQARACLPLIARFDIVCYCTNYKYEVLSLSKFFSLDNHDILALKLFDLDKEDESLPGHEVTATIVPKAINAAAYRGISSVVYHQAISYSSK